MIVIRDATATDLELLRHRWVRIMCHGTGDHDEMLELGGGRRVSRAAWRLMVERLVDVALPSASVLVADLASVPGEPVGWIAWDSTELEHLRLRMVSVLGAPNGGGGLGMRRKGVATALLDAAIGSSPFRATFTTPAGDALLGAWRARRAAA